MQLNNPVTVNIQGIETVLDHLNIVIIDNTSMKLVMVKVHPAAKPITLWKRPEYDHIGDYTQEQLENKLLEVLGPDISQGLQNLFNIETV